jgi:hypothetical protein
LCRRGLSDINDDHAIIDLLGRYSEERTVERELTIPERD